MTNIKTRYRYGTPDDKGRTPVYVDGATDPAGHVRKIGRSATPWSAVGEGDKHGTHHSRKHEAAARLVNMTDTRASVAAEIERHRARSTQAPDGWRFAAWTEIEREGYRQARPVSSAPYIYGGEGERYPARFTGQPVTLTRIARLHNGWLVVSGTESDDPAPYVLLMDPAHAALGALVREQEPRHIAPGECMGCETDGPLYQAGTRLGCASCTAADLGVSPDGLPAPIRDDGAVWWSIGDTVRRAGEIQDEEHEPETGRVIEIETLIVERERRIAVDFGDRWPVRWQPAGLAPLA